MNRIKAKTSKTLIKEYDVNPVSIKRVRQLRIQIQNELRDAGSSTDSFFSENENDAGYMQEPNRTLLTKCVETML